MFTGIEGFYPERVRQDMKWNRVLNLQGTSGGNISQDLLTELLINEFKGRSSSSSASSSSSSSSSSVSLKLTSCPVSGVIEFSKGSFTRQQVEQSAHLAGAQARHLDRLFFTGGNPLNLSSYLSRVTSSSCRRTEDVSRFVQEFKTDELFRFKPGRKHSGFSSFRYQQRVREPERMGRCMRRLREELDRRTDGVL